MADEQITQQSSPAPAEGERRAMTGYLPQYEIAAWSIMRHLREQSFESIRLGDTDAGRVDDFIILSTNAVDGHSVKWSERKDTVTFLDFTRPRDKAPCWVAQLADGWKRLGVNHPNRRVAVHLVTCDIPSKSDKCPGANKEPFAAFYYEAWVPFRSDGKAIPDKWKTAWEAWQRASGLTADEFIEFAKACHLDFHARTAADRTFLSRDDEVLHSQLKQLAAELANIVRDPHRQVEFTRDELLTRVGWSHLLEFRHRHEFPTRDPYEPIESSVRELTTKLTTLNSGYLALLGSPGSGKSSLLTRTLEAGLDKHRLVKYYAFVPGSADPRTRGESVNFLHDLVLALERAGFSAGQSQGNFDRDLLLGRLNEQLQMLGADFKTSEFPTVILIDGLDHIPREQTPQQSLIRDLPDPDQIPEGVFFVLGSQTDDLPGLPPAVRQSIQESGRRIQIGQMTREATLKVIGATHLPVSPSAEQQERIVVLSGGHPLALSLLLNRLKGATTADQMSAALTDTIAFTGDVDKYYFSYWQQIEAVASLADLLGLLARLRRPIDIDWVASWNPSPPLGELRRRFGHFFREVRPGHLEFFHNSFRQFILSRTATLSGGTPANANRDFHMRIATICETSDAPNSWEVVYHLAMAGDAVGVLARATPDYFRQQLSALRPLESVARDARYVAAAAGQLGNADTLVAFALFLSELSQRAFSLTAWTVGGSLLSLGYLDKAMEYVWEGNELQIGQEEALRVARSLFVRDQAPLARRVFEAAEPFSLIQPAGEVEGDFNRETSDLLRAWAEAVPLFRPVDEVVGLIQGFVPPKSTIDEAQDAREWRKTLLYWAGQSMERLGRTAEYLALEKCLKELEGGAPDLSVWSAIHRFRRCASRGQVAEATAMIEELLKAPTFASFSDHAKLLIAQGAHAQLPHHGAPATILKAIKQPKVDLDGVGEPDFSEAMAVFRFYRLLMLTGGEIAPNTAAPDPAKDSDWPRVLLERCLVQLAKVSADAARGKTYTATDVRRELHQPLRLFNRTWKERRRWHGWYRVERLRDELDQLIVEVVKEHGPAALEELRAEFEQLWTDKETQWAWSPEARRNVVMELYDAGLAAEWTRAQLETIADTMLEGKDVAGKIGECERQAEAWADLGDRDAAILELRRLVSVSFGVGYRKDYQMDEWVEWLDTVLPLDPAKVGERLALFAASIAGTEETTEGRGTRTAAIALIRSCVPASPLRAVRLIHWFEKHRCIDHAEAIAACLQIASERRLCRPSVLKAVYVHLLLTFSTEPHTSLVKALFDHYLEDGSKQASGEVCKELADAVRVRSLPTSRPFILRALAETAQSVGLSLRECGLELLPSRAHQDGKYEHTLKLRDGTSLTQEQAVARATCVDGFLGLVKESNESYYRWSTLLEALCPTLSRAEATRLAHGLPAEFKDSLALSAISQRLSELGERTLAWQVAERALQASPTYGWAEYLDGGTRLKALMALVAADAVPGRERALKEVAANLSSESGSPFDLARRLIDIVPLLGAGLKPEQFYPMVEDYVRLLSSPLELLGEASSKLVATPTDDNCERALCELLAFHMVDLIPLVAQGALKAFAEILLSGSPAGEKVVKEMLAGTEFQRVAAVGLLDALATKSPDAVRPYGQVLQGLVQARNWWISRAAERLCIALKLENTPQRASATLPAIYQLALPPSEDKMPSVGVDEPLPDSENPRDMVRPYDFQLGIIAKMAQLDEENLFIAAAREMKLIADAPTLTAQSESAYRSHLERAGLKLPFRRRRGAVAREAMRRIASDLIDAQRVHPDNVEMLFRLVAAQDPDLALFDPGPRPVAIRPLGGLDQYGSNAVAWMESKTYPFDSHLREFAGRVVLGEVARLKALDWSVPTETRISFVGTKGTMSINAENPFERVFDVPKGSYSGAVPHEGGATDAVIVRNQWIGADTDGSDWIALNPAIAKKLEWTLSSDGLFRWVNGTDEVMVETLWWKDGCVELGPYQRETEVGEGFLVVATPGAAEEIFRLVQKPTRHLLLQRSCVADHCSLEAPTVYRSEPLVRS
ncbi:MAG: ATP-binding protein [Phycisphaerales bacterium]